MEQTKPIEQHFEKCDTVRAPHLLWEDVLKQRPDLRGTRNKMGFYMLLHENPWGAIWGKDARGDLGLGLRFIP